MSSKYSFYPIKDEVTLLLYFSVSLANYSNVFVSVVFWKSVEHYD